jgi:hypothetical protein
MTVSSLLKCREKQDYHSLKLIITMITDFKSLIPEKLAIRAHNGTSFSPEKLGKSTINEFHQSMEEAKERFKKVGGNWESEFDDFVKKSAEKLISALHSKSSVLSPMITGPARFPVRANNKRINSYEKKINDYLSFVSYGPEKYAKQLRREEERAKTPADRVEEMRKKIKLHEELQERMKGDNKIAKSKKLSTEEKIEKLIERGYDRQKAELLLEPDFCGRIGWAGYQLTNNSANIRRMKKRLEELELKEEMPTKKVWWEVGEVWCEINTDADRVQIFFPGKPDDQTRTFLKQRSFRWSPRFSAWQRKHTRNGLEAAKQVKEYLEN